MGKDKHVLLVLDRAGWHVAKDLVIPEGIHLVTKPDVVSGLLAFDPFVTQDFFAFGELKLFVQNRVGHQVRVSGLLAFDPFVTQDFFAFGEAACSGGEAFIRC